MNARNTILWACIIAAGSTQTHAGIFTWFTGTGLWENPAMWNGPAGQYPDSILDTATISGSVTSATLGQNLAIGTLNVLNSAIVESEGHSIFVNNDTLISGSGSWITVSDTPSLRDFDTDTLTVSGGFLALRNGLAQFDEALIVNDNGSVLGVGTIEMNSTTGNIVLVSGGTIRAQNSSESSDILRITRTNSSTSKLDWTDPDSHVQVWLGKTIINEIPYTGPLGGEIQISSQMGDASFESVNGFIAGAGSHIIASGYNATQTASLIAPFLDSYGLITVAGTGEIDSPIVALRGEVKIGADSVFNLNANLLSFHSIEMNSIGDNAAFELAAPPAGIMSFKNGQSSIIMGAGSRFDLDGIGDTTVNIDANASLWLEAEYLDFSTQSPFDGTLNIDGALHVEPVNDASTWANAGEINLESGAITGRQLINSGTIRGTGSIEATVINNGEIIADGGTLSVEHVVTEGDNTPATGVIRAQTGDLIMNAGNPDALNYFSGSAFVGNGSGIREVLQLGGRMTIRQNGGVTGSMELNSGFAVFRRFSNQGLLTVRGQSLIRAIGTDPADRISFSTQSVNTIIGELEIDGETWFVPTAQFIGEGMIRAVSPVKDTYFQDDSDLGDVGFASGSGVYIAGFSANGHVTMGSLYLEPTADLNICMGDITDDITSQKFIVHDDAHLEGTLTITWDGDGDVPVGETVTVLQAANITGGFDDIDFSGLGFNRRAFVTVDNDSVEVFVTCSADLNADGQTNFFDVSQFMSLYTSMDPAADLNEDGQLNFFDVSIFLSVFNIGC